jgi:hypothetical protein
MPQILPIRELKNTAKISKFVEEINEPIFITKNGYGAMVVMNMEVYERFISKSQKMDVNQESSSLTPLKTNKE